jgi:hypothetical protein
LKSGFKETKCAAALLIIETQPGNGVPAGNKKKSIGKETQLAFENPKAVINYNNSWRAGLSEQS